MDTIKAIKDSGLAPGEVWFIATLILIGILTVFFWIIAAFFRGYLDEQKESRKQIIESIAQLTIIVTKLETIQETHAEKIKDIQNKRRA